MKAGKHQRDLLKLNEIRGLLQELESSGLLNILYHLVKKIRSRITSYLAMQDHKPKVPINESIKALFTLVGRFRYNFQWMIYLRVRGMMERLEAKILNYRSDSECRMKQQKQCDSCKKSQKSSHLILR